MAPLVSTCFVERRLAHVRNEGRSTPALRVLFRNRAMGQRGYPFRRCWSSPPIPARIRRPSQDRSLPASFRDYCRLLGPPAHPLLPTIVLPRASRGTGVVPG